MYPFEMTLFITKSMASYIGTNCGSEFLFIKDNQDVSLLGLNKHVELVVGKDNGSTQGNIVKL